MTVKIVNLALPSSFHPYRNQHLPATLIPSSCQTGAHNCGIVLQNHAATAVAREGRDDTRLVRTSSSAEHDPADEDDDARSDISPLQCGSILPNHRYDPSQDPAGKPFMPPLEIHVHSRRRSSGADESSRSDPPAWLVLPQAEQLSASAAASSPPTMASQRRPRSLTPDKKGRAVASAVAGIRSAPCSPQEQRASVSPATSPRSSSTTQQQRLLPPPPAVVRRPFDPNTAAAAATVVVVNNGRQPVLVTSDFSGFEGTTTTRPLPSYAKPISAVPSFTDTVEMSHSETSSSGEPHAADGDERNFLPTLTTGYVPKQEQQQQQDPPKQRKGMVRREFQRRVLSRFKKRSTSKNMIENINNINNNTKTSCSIGTTTRKGGSRISNGLHQACGRLT